MSHFISPILELLGIDAKTQSTWMVIAYIAAFVIYAIRSPAHDRVYSALFVAMVLSLSVLLFTELARIRWLSLDVLVIASAGAFIRHFAAARRQKRARHR